ncbi:hypothetical protein H2201_000729 [Coniosporium apollinis]|uniref:Actin cytoskeleton-regulatory complex protein SLA1 n=1 Tax=Coniosporium apollinis TaxID=61459 RepID=A0ABQ9P431_9PEZI|nr:hypothetical protein H2201_000729 [Coniosporium apollinis]
MVFLGIYRALYDYNPQSSGELEIKEGDLLFVLEKSTDDDWWRAKKKAQSEDEEEPEGLIPNNYVEEATPLTRARALYDYTRQTDEELSFTEDAILDVYDTSDPDWTLVGLAGEYGFAPANYIEASNTAAAPAMPARPRAVEAEPEPEADRYSPPTPDSPASPPPNPAAAVAAIIQQKTRQRSASSGRAIVSPPPALSPPPRQPQYTPEESDEEPPPAIPQRPVSQQLSPPITQYATRRSPSPPGGFMPTPSPRDYSEDHELQSPTGFHLYNIHEMISHMGKNKKMPMTLGINIAKGLITISPEKSRDGPTKEWTADKLTHYSIEGKHVFMELVRPSKSADLHAGAKDTAMEIVSALGELAGAARAEGLREVIAASTGGGQKKGKMLYEFMAQGDDEVTVAVDDEVIVLDDTKSDEWWMVRRLKNGKEGVVPSSYVEITGVVEPQPDSMRGLNAARSTVEQNRLEEERLARQASRANKKKEDKQAEVGPGFQLPERTSSRAQEEIDTRRTSQGGRRESKDAKAPTTSKPNKSRIRTWTDRTGSFKVEAEFIGLKDGKIHLHKLNGVKIAVPVPKMSIEDLEYVERATGVSLDEDKPLSDIKRRSTQRAKDKARDSSARDAPASSRPKAGATIEQPKKPEYDWFDFFLACGINPQICERYASAFARDQMGEENLPDITEKTLRVLGLKEGDILRVLKHLDTKFGRNAAQGKRGVSFGDTTTIQEGEGGDGANGTAGGLFSGPGGALKNNTRKGRPAPPVQTSDVVDPKVFEQTTDGSPDKRLPAEAAATPLATAPKREPVLSGFDDDAWENKPTKSANGRPAAVSAPPAQAPAPAPAPTLPPDLAGLDLLTPPLQPTPAPMPTPQTQVTPAAAPAAAQQQPVPTGATPSLFEQLANSPANLQHQQTAAPRQRPQAPQQLQPQAGLIAPPPQRAASAPQNFPQSQFAPPPLQPQLTGYQSPGQLQARPAPVGQSMQEQLNQQRMPQQFAAEQMPPQGAGFPQQFPGQFANGIMPQPTGFQQFGQPPQQFQQLQSTGFPNPAFQQQLLAGQQSGSPFADPPARPFQPQATGFQPQPTGFQQQTFTPQPMQPQQTGINAFLPPPLQPQRTGFPPQPTGFQPQQTGFGQPPSTFNAPPMPPMPPMPQQTLAPLVPQKTGPPPPVRFGVAGEANKLVPQPTGRRANLSQATPQNPFGF